MSEFYGIPIVVSNALPIDPSPREWARRFVRHGMRDIVEWLGEEVGPEPDEQTHVLLANDGIGYGSAIVSAAFAERLREKP